ncbi:MFS transporter [Ilumatobacter nonamiensis]|uniref:MFS transporter n=1 Tax=Ilumatobacter nonamiensis TaxID=467093 RepID=UPI000686AA48|nr:MFS transporter [Ilumatobacter nonamiensis]
MNRATTREARDQVQGRIARNGRYQRWVLLTALAGMFATTFPVTLLAVSLATIAEDLGTTETVIAWVISAPLLGSAIALPILGKLGDLYGHRRVFLTGFTISTVVTALTMFAWDPLSLIVLRGLAVVIGAATIPSSMALINSEYPRSQRAKAMGWWSLVAAGSPAIGLVIGGPLIDAVGWRPMFGIQAVLSVIPVAAAYLVLRETPRRTDVGFDVLGSLTLALGTGGFMFALNQIPARGFDPAIAIAFAAGAIGLAAFCVVESRVAFPLLPLEFFRRRNFTASILAALFSGAAYMGGFILAPLLLQSVFALSVSATSLVMLVRPASFSATSPIGGSIATKIGERPVAMFGSVAIAVALVLLGLGGTSDLLILVVFALVLQGIGNGTSQPTITATLSNSVDEADLGIASAAQRMAFQVGSALGISTLTSIYGGTEEASDFLTAYLVGAGLAVIALAFTSMIRSTTFDDEPNDDDSARTEVGGLARR